MANHVELKKLETLRRQFSKEITLEKSRQKESSRIINELLAKLKDVNDQIKNLKKHNEIIITEHAILRYIERVMGVDIERIKAEILPEEVKEQVLQVGSGRFPVKNGEMSFKIRVKKGNVVTVLTKEDQ